MPYVYLNPYKSSYLAAQQELQQREAELVFVTNRIAQLKETIRTLAPLAENGVAPTGGLSELCRQILMANPNRGLSAGQVVELLAQMGVDLSGYSQPLAVLHTTLTRICRQPGFAKSTFADGQPLYVFDTTGLYRSGIR